MSRKLKVGQKLSNVVYKGNHLIIQKIRECSKTVPTLFIGNGHSIELDDQNRITWADPGMHEFKANITKDATVYAFYFVKKVAKLDEASRELADFINQIQEEKVILLGHSKSGICVEEACNYTEKEVDVCIAVSAPHSGTISVCPDRFTEKLKNPIMSKIYLNTFSNHQVDRDISPDSMIIKKVHRPMCAKHINIISVLNLKNAWKNLIDLGSLILDRRVGMYGDAIVSEQSQRVNWTNEEIVIYASHATSLKIAIRYVNDILL